jgi:hypothetical protein
VCERVNVRMIGFIPCHPTTERGAGATTASPCVQGEHGPPQHRPVFRGSRGHHSIALCSGGAGATTASPCVQGEQGPPQHRSAFRGSRDHHRIALCSGGAGAPLMAKGGVPVTVNVT